MKYKLKKLPVIETRTCQRCGAEFDITARQKRKLYCDNCRKINKIEKQKLYENKPEIQVKRQEYGKKYRKENYEPKRHSVICDRCGRYFIMGSGVSKTCIECLKKSKSYDERFRADCRRIYH